MLNEQTVSRFYCKEYILFNQAKKIFIWILKHQLGYDIEALKITTQNLQNLLAVTQHYYIPLLTNHFHRNWRLILCAFLMIIY